jgi:hypothetical protein
MGQEKKMMQWDRSDVIGLARAGCKFCQGTGLHASELRKQETPCHCVFRAIFRACFNRFRECHTVSLSGSVSLDRSRGPEGRMTFGRKREEFMADFCLISRRALDDYEHRIFRYHFLLGAEWRMCARRLNLDRGNYFHVLYRVESKLGRAFAEVEPYPLYPVSDYFGGPGGKAKPIPPKRKRRVRDMRFTLPLSA